MVCSFVIISNSDELLAHLKKSLDLADGLLGDLDEPHGAIEERRPERVVRRRRGAPAESGERERRERLYRIDAGWCASGTRSCTSG